MNDSFYVSDGPGRFVSTLWTTGPWDPRSQHAGPPAALLGRAVDLAGASDMRTTRIVFDILRPVPVAPLTVEVQTVRPGRSVELLHASIVADGKEVMRASAWRIRVTELDLAPRGRGDPPPPGPAEGEEVELFEGADQSYLRAMEWRFVRGTFLDEGPATAWLRARYPLVDGELNSPLTRVLIAADSGSGISGTVPFDRWLFVNPDLSVYLAREPAGEWVCLESETTLGPEGNGLAATRLWDETGPIGYGMQTLFISPRG
ncbi:MAG TPA: thioesterase family protein [Actinomycetota bacterium]|nr:thioesterase family protein [Actinomycetota bacterium]